MRLVLLLLFVVPTLLHADDHDLNITTSGAKTKVTTIDGPATEAQSSSNFSISYKGFSAKYEKTLFERNYAEIGLVHEYGFSISGYSYTELRTNGVRIGYKYDDGQTQWSPFIIASVQRASSEYVSGIQPRNDFGGTIGLAFSFTHENVLTLSLFREFVKNPVSLTTLEYTFESSQIYGEAKVGLAVGNAARSQQDTRRYVNWKGLIGYHLNDHFSAFAYSESTRYRDFLLLEQEQTGIGVKTTF